MSEKSYTVKMYDTDSNELPIPDNIINMTNDMIDVLLEEHEELERDSIISNSESTEIQFPISDRESNDKYILVLKKGK